MTEYDLQESNDPEVCQECGLANFASLDVVCARCGAVSDLRVKLLKENLAAAESKLEGPDD